VFCLLCGGAYSCLKGSRCFCFIGVIVCLFLHGFRFLSVETIVVVVRESVVSNRCFFARRKYCCFR